MVLNLDAVYASALSNCTKGFPPSARGLLLRDVASRRWSVPGQDLPLPLLTLRQSAVEHNLDLMQRYCDRQGVLLAPHGKTTMAPQLFDAQLRRGAWGITAATAEQIQVYRAFGVQRIMLANQLVGDPAVPFLAAELEADPGLELLSWVDSRESVECLAARPLRGRPWQVLLELGWEGGRTGARDARVVQDVVTAVRSSGGSVQLVGVGVFEGLLSVTGVASQAAGGARATVTLDDFLERAVETAAELHRNGDLPDDYLLTGGGSTSFDAVVRHFRAVAPPVRVVVRPGCYVTHDHGLNDQLSPMGTRDHRVAPESGTLWPALELWSYVHSTPEPGLAFLALGRRDAPYDAGLPVPFAALGPTGTERRVLSAAEVTGLNDQHCYVRHDGSLRVGDRVVLGISHPCAAFDKWQAIPVVDDEGLVVDVVRTYF